MPALTSERTKKLSKTFVFILATYIASFVTIVSVANILKNGLHDDHQVSMNRFPFNKSQEQPHKDKVSSLPLFSPPFPPSCSPEEKKKVATVLPNKTAISRETDCPDATWLLPSDENNNEMNSDDILFEPSHGRTPVSIFVGCNKAIDAVDALRMLSLDASINKTAWLAALERHGLSGINAKGICGAEKAPEYPLKPNHIPRPAIVHCIEPMPSTFQIINAAVNELNWQTKLVTHHAALSNDDGEDVLFPNAEAGTEHLGLRVCIKHRIKYRKICERVKQYRLDSFVQKYIDKSENPIIDFLLVDAEGYDWPILLGSRQTLQRTKYLEFENNEIGAWKEYQLSSAVDALGLLNFICYWPGREGKLYKITDCWQNQFNQKIWSNVVCVNMQLAPKLAKRMQNQYLQTVEAIP